MRECDEPYICLRESGICIFGSLDPVFYQANGRQSKRLPEADEIHKPFGNIEASLNFHKWNYSEATLINLKN